MIHTDIKEQIKDAMRARDTLRLEVLRSILTALVNELVATGKTPQDMIDDEGALAVIKRLSKQRKDASEQFTKGDRPELAQKEEDEFKILEEWLPKMMSQDEIRPIAEKKKAELGIEDKSKMGQFIGALMKDLKGKADGGDVKAVVEELLG